MQEGAKRLEEMGFRFSRPNKHGNGHSSNADVCVRCCRRDDNKYQMSVRFRNDIAKKISKTGYALWCFVNHALYFAEAEPGEGLKLSGKGSQSTKTACMNENETLAIPMIGDYTLEFDNRLGLYYIERKK